MSSSHNNYMSSKCLAVDALRRSINGLQHSAVEPSRTVEFKELKYSSLPARPSAVLVVLRYDHSATGDCRWDVLLTLRTSRMRLHGGLVSLPGGKLEKGEDVERCALREAKEEVNLNEEDVEIVGQLASTPTLGNLSVWTIISVLNTESFQPRRNPIEVEDVFWMPLSEFMNSEIHRSCYFPLASDPSSSFQIHYFDYSCPAEGSTYTVWGLTARILMLISSMVFDQVPKYINLENTPPVDDPLILGYIPSTHRVAVAKL